MMISMRSLVTTLLVVWLCCASSALSAQPVTFHVVQDSSAGTISVLRGGSRDVVLVQNAQERIRPFLHPIMSPDGKGMLTEYRPSHHPHQTGVLGIEGDQRPRLLHDLLRPRRRALPSPRLRQRASGIGRARVVAHRVRPAG